MFARIKNSFAQLKKVNLAGSTAQLILSVIGVIALWSYKYAISFRDPSLSGSFMLIFTVIIVLDLLCIGAMYKKEVKMDFANWVYYWLLALRLTSFMVLVVWDVFLQPY